MTNDSLDIHMKDLDKELVFFDTFSIDRVNRNSLSVIACDCGATVVEQLIRGVTICVCNTIASIEDDSQTISSSVNKMSNYTRDKMFSEQNVPTCSQIANSVGAKVMTSDQFAQFLKNHKMRVKKLLSDLPRKKCARVVWTQSKPVASSEAQRLIIQDLDCLVPLVSQSFNPSKLELCKVHVDAPSGVSIYLPPRLWASLAQSKETKKCSLVEDNSAFSAQKENRIHTTYDMNELPLGDNEQSSLCAKGEVQPQLKETKQRSYCECCKLSYTENFETHCKSITHQTYLLDGSNFEYFDEFVHRFKTGKSILHLFPVRHSTVTRRHEPSILDVSVKPQAPQVIASGNSKIVDDDQTYAESVSSTLKFWKAPAMRQAVHKPYPPKKPLLGKNGAVIPYTEITDMFVDMAEIEGGKQLGKRVVKTRRGDETGPEVVGRVEGWNKGVGGQSLYSVVYGDGDMEEMSSEEVANHHVVSPKRLKTLPVQTSSMFRTAKAVLIDNTRKLPKDVS